MVLAKIDCTEESELCGEHGVNGYPTLKVFYGPDVSKATPYEGSRESKGIISYMKRLARPAVTKVTDDNIESFKEADSLVIVAFIDAEDEKSLQEFKGLAEAQKINYAFGVSSDEDVARAEGIEEFPAVVVYKTFEEARTVYPGEFSAPEITKFIARESVPILGEIGPETYSSYFRSGLPIGFLFVTEENKDDIVEELLPIAKKFKDHVVIATIDAVKFGSHASNVNLEVGKWPSFSIHDLVKNLKYPFSQENDLESKALEEFLDEFASGSLKPSIKSEPIPEKQEDSVFTVVGNSYEEIVLDDDKDVLIEFYAQWCGHCKTLAPKYEALAKRYEAAGLADKVILGKIDATLNDVPDSIQGFPTIKLYPAKKKDSPVDYNGDRSPQSFIDFIAEHGTYKINLSELEKDSDKPAKNLGEKISEAAKGAAQAVLGSDDDSHDEL